MKKLDWIEEFVDFVRSIYRSQDFISLHEPKFDSSEEDYVVDTIRSTYVSSVGEYVTKFEKEFAEYVGSKYAVATSSGTSALHTALVATGVRQGHEVLTQALTFVATANAINYVGAKPIFIDVDIETLGMSPESLIAYLKSHCEVREGKCYNRETGSIISACIPMHTYGFPTRIQAIAEYCKEFGITLIEDAAEALGSISSGEKMGTFGECGVFSFNGNKIITTGAGGMLVTNSNEVASVAKHISTTAKLPHKWDYFHDVVGYNYRMPNLNAALGCAQLEKLDSFLVKKRELANLYRDFFDNKDCLYIEGEERVSPNYWLNTVQLRDLQQRDEFLERTNSGSIMTRPSWVTMDKLPMYSGCQNDGLKNTHWLSERIVNIPSSVFG